MFATQSTRNLRSTDSRRALVASVLGLLLASIAAPAAHAQNLTRFATPQTVGTTAPAQSVTVTLQQTGTVAAIKVLTLGNSSLDFAAASGGSCVSGLAYTAGQTCTVNVTFSPITAGERRGAVVLRTSTGATLGTGYMVGTGSGAMSVFVPGIISTVVGNASWIYNGDGGTATSTSIFLPFGFALDAAGDVFIADQGNQRIREVSAATGLVSTIAGTGFVGSSGDGGLAVNATISSPDGVAVDPAGNVFFADTGNNVIRKIDAGTGIISTVAGSVGKHGYLGDNGPATQAYLNTPNGIAIDQTGNLYIADTANNVVRKVDVTTGIITTFAGTGIQGYNLDGILATAAQLNNPWGVYVTPAGELFIADQGNQRIRKVATSGIISTIAGNGSQANSGDGGLATAAGLNNPGDSVVDAAGNIYIADSGNNRIRKINAATGIITTVAGGGQSGTGDGSSAILGGMYGPYSLALNANGDLLVADVFDNRIRMVAATSTILQYPAIRVGRVSASETATLENDGNAPFTVGTIAAVSNSQVDLPSTSCSSSTPLAPLDTCLIGVEFAPTVVGNPVYGKVSVASSAVNQPATIQTVGQVLNIDPTTTTLSTSANPANFGSNVTFSVNVSSAGTTPTGTITLLDSATTIASASLTSGGNATFSISNLSVGTHNITASYSGDSSNASSISSALAEVIKDSVAPTTTTLTASANPAQAGGPLRLTATLSIPQIDASFGNPTGTVTFHDGSTTLGTATLSGGIATLTTTTLSVGAHTITASYPGATSFSASTSNTVNLSILLSTSSTAISSSANPVVGGAPLVLSATLLSTGGTPTGSISFLDGTTLLGKATLNAQGVASLSLPGSTLAVGQHSITATYAGDVNNGPSSSSALVQTVQTANTTTVLASSANPSFQGANITFTATVSSNGGIPTGAVQFLDGSTSLGSATLNAGGTASLSIATLALGSHAITAIYAGDSLDSGSTASPLSQLVQPATASVTLASAANPGIFNSPLTLTVTVKGNGSAPTGNVVLLDGATTLTTMPLTANGVITITTSSLAIGSHTLTAQYTGDTNHPAANSATLTQAIIQATTSTLTSTTSQSIAGTSIQWRAKVTGAAGTTPTGTVNFTDGTSLLAAVALDNTGTATYTTAALAVGAHTLAAVYLGDTLSQTSTSNNIAEQVQIATTIASLTSSANPAFTGTQVTFSAAVTGNGGIPTGSITFKDGTATIGVVNLSASASATFTISTLAAGNHQITAVYSGDANDSPSTSSTLTQKIQQLSVVTLTSSANPSLLGDNVTITVAVTNGIAVLPTGTVTLTDGSTTIGTTPLTAAATATFTLNAPIVGTHTLTATYSGDVQNLAATSPALNQVVTLRPSSTSLTTTGTQLSYGQSVTLFTVVQGNGATPPTGTVTFTSGSVQLGTATLTSTGIASITLTPQQGAYTVVASYPGDTLYAASASPSTAITVGPTAAFTFTMTPASLTVVSGQHATLDIDIATANTFNDTLALGCAGLPQYATCTFSANQIAVANGSPAHLTVTVDTGDPLGAGASALNRSAASSGILACMLPGSALLGFLLWRSRKQTRRLSGLLMLALFALGIGSLGSLTGCGSSFSGQQVAPGAYSFRVVGTGNTTGATQSGVVALTVTQ